MRTLLLLIVLFTSHAYTKETKLPNVLLIFVDDLGYCDTELYGCDNVPTPNIKRLADEGVLFTDGYVSSPVCSQSRAGLLTGRHQQRFGHEYLPGAEDGLPLDEVTLADVMKESGYVTGIVGKWHLGDAAKFNPIHRGFDEFFGLTPGAVNYLDPTQENSKSVRWSMEKNKYVSALPSSWVNQPPRLDPSKSPYILLKGTTEVSESEYLTEAFTREAVRFIEKNKNQPFFLYLPHFAVHGPLQVTQKYYDRFPTIEDEASRIYAAMTSALDDSIGTILDKIQGLGLEQDTLIIFISDNGGGVSHYPNNFPLRGGKHTMFEGGVRVPFAMKWPARIPKGVTYEEPISSLDIFPTIVAATRGKLPEEVAIDGVDLVPHLNGSNSAIPHNQLFWRSGSIWAAREGDWKLIYAGDRYWLYDLEKDIGEKLNLAGSHKDVVQRIKTSYDKWNTKNIEPLWPSYGEKSGDSYAIDGVPVNWNF